jgi:hypothetical protein
VVPDQKADAPAQSGGKAQAAQNIVRHALAYLRVTVKIAGAAFIRREDGGLANVVQERGKAERRLRRRGRDRGGGVFPGVVDVVRIVLTEAAERQDLRQSGAPNGNVLQQHRADGFSAEKAGELRGRAFLRDGPE